MLEVFFVRVHLELKYDNKVLSDWLNTLWIEVFTIVKRFMSRKAHQTKIQRLSSYIIWKKHWFLDKLLVALLKIFKLTSLSRGKLSTDQKKDSVLDCKSNKDPTSPDMDGPTLTLIKSRVLSEVKHECIRDEIMKIIAVIEESRAPSILNLNAQVLERSGGTTRSSIRYDRLSKQELMELFRKIHNVSKKGENYLGQLEEYVKLLMEKEDWEAGGGLRSWEKLKDWGVEGGRKLDVWKRVTEACLEDVVTYGCVSELVFELIL